MRPDAVLGADNGGCWEDAFVDLQDALAVAAPGDEIWVAAGVYTPEHLYCTSVPSCSARNAWPQPWGTSS